MMSKDKIIKYCTRITEFSLCAIAFYIPISIALVEIFSVFAILSWGLKKIISRTSFSKIFYPSFMKIPVFLYLFVCLLSAVFSTNRQISFNHLFFKTLEYSLLFFITIEVIDRRVLRNILIALVFSATLVSIDGILQYFTKHDFLRNRPMAIFEHQQRINGPFKIPTDFANYVVTIFPLAASLSFLNFKKSWLKSSLIIISFLLFIAIFLSVTKSAWLALILAFVLLGVLVNKRLLILVLLVITIILCFLPFYSDVVQFRILHFFEFREGAVITQRDYLWKTGLDMFMERPVLGQGLGTFMYNFQRFKPKDYPLDWEISYAHNCFLQIASETGILGFLSFVLIITLLFFIAIKVLIKKRGNSLCQILAGILIGIFAYLIGSFFDTNLYSLPLAVLFWLMMGLACGLIKIIDLEPA